MPFRIVIFSETEPTHILRLITRIHREVPEAEVCGVLCERRPGKSMLKRFIGFAKNLKEQGFLEYAAAKAIRQLAGKLSVAGHMLLHLLHGGRPTPSPSLSTFESLNCSFKVTSDYHCDDALEFVRQLRPDLGIVYGTRILKPSLFSLPRLGSINIHKRKVPDYRGGGPVGLWELLDGQTEIGVTVHQVTEKLDAGAVLSSATIPIEPFDDLTSLALKAHVVGNDLIVQSVKNHVSGTITPVVQQGSGQMFKLPGAPALRRYEKRLARSRPAFQPFGSRSWTKMFVKSAAALPEVLARNWKCRLGRSFPVTILFHHLISDRPHPMGVSTRHFLRHVEFLKKHYDIVSLDDAIRLLKTNTVARPTVVLTFDDGYRDNFVNLRCIVEQTGVPITMFVSSDHITRGHEFKHDVETGTRGFLPLTWKDLRQMQLDGFEIASHTRTHFDCGSQNPEALEDEIGGSKEELEKHLGRRVEFFSFPFGYPENISPEAAAMAARVYSFILSACGGTNTVPIDSHLRRRCHPSRLWDLELQIQGVLEREFRFDLPRLSSPAGFSQRVGSGTSR